MLLTVDGYEAYIGTGNVAIDPARQTVLFIHGVGQDHTIWTLPMRHFARHGRNSLAVDLPGHGRSAGKPLRTVEEMGEWVVDLLDALGISSAALVGHSMGSLVALEVAGTHPDRVRSIALVGVSVPLAVSDALMGSAAEDSHDAIDMLTYWGHGRRAMLGGSPTPGLWMTGVSMRLREQADSGVIHAGLRACAAYSIGLERASAIECPVLLLMGEKDVMTPIRGADRLRAVIEAENTVIFEGAGHALLQERADQVLDELARIV